MKMTALVFSATEVDDQIFDSRSFSAVSVVSCLCLATRSTVPN